jgi:hypothetical protein
VFSNAKRCLRSTGKSQNGSYYLFPIYFACLTLETWDVVTFPYVGFFKLASCVSFMGYVLDM